MLKKNNDGTIPFMRQRTPKEMFENFDGKKLNSMTKKELLVNYMLSIESLEKMKKKTKQEIIKHIMHTYKNYMFWSKFAN